VPEVLSDEEVEAIEALIRAAIRWSDTEKSTVMEKFGLLMADYKRLRTEVGHG